MSTVEPGFDLSDQVAVVIGGGRGIGREIALALADPGASVAVTARSADQVHATADMITSLGGRAIALPVDVTDETGVQQAIATIQDRLGAVTLLVNNAAYCPAWWHMVADESSTSRAMQARIAGPTYPGIQSPKLQ